MFVRNFRIRMERVLLHSQKLNVSRLPTKKVKHFNKQSLNSINRKLFNKSDDISFRTQCANIIMCVYVFLTCIIYIVYTHYILCLFGFFVLCSRRTIVYVRMYIYNNIFRRIMYYYSDWKRIVYKTTRWTTRKSLENRWTSGKLATNDFEMKTCFEEKKWLPEKTYKLKIIILLCPVLLVIGIY